MKIYLYLYIIIINKTIKQHKTMIIERTFQGAIKLSDFVKGEYYSRQYFDYTLREAKQAFKEYIKEEQKKIFVNKKK